MIDQVDSCETESKSELAKELVKRHLLDQKPEKIKVKMTFKPSNRTNPNPIARN